MDIWTLLVTLTHPLCLDHYVGSILVNHIKIYEPLLEKMLREPYPPQRRKSQRDPACSQGQGSYSSSYPSLIRRGQLIVLLMILFLVWTHNFAFLVPLSY